MPEELKVAILTPMRDSYEPYLFEWLNYHHSIGVDYFFLFDNDSIIPLAKSIENIPFKDNIYIYPMSGQASPTLPMCRLVYEKGLEMLRNKSLPFCDRVAFIDEDEFIICKNNKIKDVLADYTEFSGIGISWRMFGSSGLLHQTPEPQMVKFIKYTGSNYTANNHIKSIVNPYLVKGIISPHAFSYTQGYCVNTDKEPILKSFSPPNYEKMWVNHYWTRSFDEWVVKAGKCRFDVGIKRDVKALSELDNHCTESL